MAPFRIPELSTEIWLIIAVLMVVFTGCYAGYPAATFEIIMVVSLLAAF